MTPDTIVQNYLTAADKLFRSCRPSPDQWAKVMQHQKNADLLLWLGNSMQAIAELDHALEALRPRGATQEGLFHEAA